MHVGAQLRGLRAPCERFAPWVTPGPRITRFRLAADLGRMGLDTHRVSNKVSKITSRHLVPLDRAFPAHALLHERPSGATIRMHDAKEALQHRTDRHEADVLDIFVQLHRNRRAAVRFFRTLLKTQGHIPRRLIIDQLRSYAAACRTVMPSVVHVTESIREQSSQGLPPTDASAGSARCGASRRPPTCNGSRR